MKIKKVAVLGAGAVGSYVIWGLSSRNDIELGVIAEGERAERLKQNGCTINGKIYHPEVWNPRETDAVDLLIVALKYGSLSAALESIQKATSENTIIMSLMNGVDSEEIIAEKVGVEHLLPAVIKVASHKEEDGYHFDPETTIGIIFGELTAPYDSDRIRAIEELFKDTGIHFRATEYAREEMWSKFRLNVCNNLPQAILGAGVGCYRDSVHMKAISDGLKGELEAIAQAKGIDLSKTEASSGRGSAVPPSARYSTLQDLDAGRHTEIDIFAGETFGVVGESGCGKSTLGRTLIRLIPATDGHVYLDGEDISGLKGKALKQMRKKAQIIFQDPSACLNPRRTVRQILMEPFQIHHMTGSMDVDARIEELLHLVGLDTYHLSRYPHELSGGQKQRIGIARALALEPKLIICDEAVSALDVSVQAQVLNLLQELKERLGLTYFFISHNLNVVYQVSDRVGVMYLGKMVEIAAYDQLYEKRYHPYTEALLSAIPQVDADDRTERIHLTGEVPSPSDPPSGCPFHTRCPKACDICSKEIPQLKEIEKGHFVACHLYQ